MTVYLINITLILFWRLYFTRKKFPNAKKYFCIICAVQWILISGLRDWNVGTDTVAYYNAFEQVKITPWSTLLRDLLGYLFQDSSVKDPGYQVLMKFSQIIIGDYQHFLLAIAIMFFMPMSIWIYRNSASPCTSFILFSTLFYSFYAVTGHRQTIATALVSFVGYELIKQRKFWKFMAVVFVAYLIHKSSLVFVPLYFMAMIPVTFSYMISCAVVIILVAFLGRAFYGPIALWIGYGEYYIDYSEGGAEMYAILLVLLCVIIWAMYPRIKKRRNDAPLLFHVNSLALMTGLLVIQNQSFMRVQQYYSLFLMITIPEIINTVKREYRLLVYLLFGAVMILYLVYNNPQYQFFFMS